MNKRSENRNQNSPIMEKKFFMNGKFHWKKSEDDVWADLEEKLNSSNVNKVRKLYFGRQSISIAASIIVIVGIVSFFRFYSNSTYTLSGVHKNALLPDGSIVYLNAESKITYYPLWWKIKRIIKFEGEGFFEVQKGNSFIVHTALGNVEVLGTSFNVFARSEASTVSCVTGRVKVTSNNKKHVILKSNSKAELFKDKDIKVSKDVNVLNDMAWRKNSFRFESVPLKNVFLEIERQYAVNIELDFSATAIYSGNFNKKDSVENILDYVCSAMGLIFKKKSKNEYIIFQE